MAQLRVGPLGDLWPSLGVTVEIVSGLNSVECTNSEEAERGGGRISEKRRFHQNITLKKYWENKLFRIFIDSKLIASDV